VKKALSGSASAAEAAAVEDLSRCEIGPDRAVEVYSQTIVTAGKAGQEALKQPLGWPDA